jgi:hypothetical protein
VEKWDSRDKRRLDLFRQFYADRIREAYDIPPQDALTAATILLGGTLGLADTWFRKGWPRRPMIDTFVRVSMSAIEGLARPRS